MMLSSIHSKQKGIGLLELMLALAIIAVLIFMATRYFGAASAGQKMNQATAQIVEIKQALYQWQVSHGGKFIGAKIKASSGSGSGPLAGYLSGETAEGKLAVGDGTVEVKDATDTTVDPEIEVSITDQKICDGLVSRFGGGQCSGGKGTIKYSMIGAQ